jgi:hypothetical protein
MFTIDLLKGKGIPERSGPQGIVVASVTFVVPVVVALIMFGCYLSDSIAISIEKKEITSYETKASKLSNAVELRRSFEKQKTDIRECLSEVSSSIGRHTQWSPILAAVVESIPDSMVLTKLDVAKRPVKKKVPKKDDPHTMVEKRAFTTMLSITVSGKPKRDYERAVRNFRDRLRSSSVLGPKLEGIRIARDVGDLEGQEVVWYELNCVFKSQW